MSAKGTTMSKHENSTPAVVDNDIHSAEIAPMLGHQIEQEIAPRVHAEPEPGGAADTSAPATFGGFDLKRFRLQSAVNAVGGKKLLHTIGIQKPPKQRFVRCHRDHRIEVQVLIEKDGDRNVYLVEPDLCVELAGELTTVSLVLTITRQQTIFLWPITIPDESGRTNRWHESAMQASIVAVDSWVRVSANMEGGFYDVIAAPDGLGEPTWPTTAFAQIVETAFRNRIISTWDHIILRQLRGEV